MFQPSQNQTLRKKLPLTLTMIGIIVYIIVFSWWSIRRADNFNAGWYDLGIMTQTVWDVGHGHGFTFTNPEAGPGGVHGLQTVRTAIHTDYLLALLAPLSWFGRTMANLLVLQSLILALGGLFIWRITNQVLNRPWLGTLFAWCYLLYPPLQFANLFEFHAVTLSITFFLAAADAILGKHHKTFWVWAGLALITKEQVGITLGLLAGYLYWRQGDRRRAAVGLVIPWLWTLIQFGLVIPQSRPGLPGNFVYDKFYGGEPGAADIIRRVLDPVQLWGRLATRIHLDDLVKLFSPLGLIMPLASPVVLLAAPEVLLYWLSDSPNQQTLFLHYHALFIPFIWLSFIFGWRNITRWAENNVPQWKKSILVLMVGLIVAGTGLGVLRASPWPWSPLAKWRLATWQERLRPQVSVALDLIPANASVALTQNLGPLLAERQTVQLLPTGIGQVEYIAILQRFFDSSVATNDKRLAERVMLDRLIPWLQRSPAYRQRYHDDRVWIFERIGQPTEPEPTWPAGLLGQ